MLYPQNVLDGEALALMGLGFRLCFYLELWCPAHGAIRCTVEMQPQDHHACPLCNRSCACGLLCRGFTRRQTPIWERWDGPVTCWLEGDEHEAQPPPPTKNEQRALDALRAGATATSVSRCYQITLERLRRLRLRHGLPIQQQRHAAR
jgi:hypothetical protein